MKCRSNYLLYVLENVCCYNKVTIVNVCLLRQLRIC